MRPKSANDISNIRQSGKILAEVLDVISSKIEPGISGIDIEQIAEKELKKLGGKPVFKGVPGFGGAPDFPSIICISVDDEVVHGIPNAKPIESGQIVSFDFGVDFNGMITDAARTVVVGDYASDQVANLVRDTKKSLDIGISQVRNGIRTGEIGSSIQLFLEPLGYGIVRDLVGHGVGDTLHEPPEIPNYGFRKSGSILKEGMTIAIEPMVTLGDWRVVVDEDGWTIKTADGSLCAHFEDTILVTEDSAEILTR